LYKVGREEVIVGLEEGGLELVNGWGTNEWMAVGKPVTGAEVGWIVRGRFGA
jgi:hypothetical protein